MKNNKSRAAVVGKTAYEGSVMHRAVERAGRNPHLKGHIHEILTQDARNLKGFLSGQHTALTKSTTASTVDLVTTRGGKVVERLQLKDTLSNTSVNKLVRQVADGKYRSARLVGTEETTELVNAAFKKAGLSKRMVSSGVSSKTTTSLAQRVGATGSGTLSKAINHAGKSGGACGAAIGAGLEAVRGVSDLIDGRRDAGEVAASVGKAGAKGYVTGYGASAAAAITSAGLATVVGTGLLSTVAAPALVAVGVGYVISELFDAIFD